MFKVTWLNSVDSTNSEALRRIGELPSGTVLAAREQTAGRGQRGNTWFSEPGKNLTFSVVLKFPAGFLAAGDAFLLNCLCSVSVADFLSGFGVPASVKWPNDIFVGGRKICGMLLENGLIGSFVAHSVMGIGMNVFQTEFPLVNATSLALALGGGARAASASRSDAVDQVQLNPVDQVQQVATGGPSKPHPLDLVQPLELDLVQCLERFLGCFEERLPMLDDAAGRRELFDAYESLLYRRDVSARYHDCLRDEDFEGVIRGVEADGRLCVEDSAGVVRRYFFKEISYVL